MKLLHPLQKFLLAGLVVKVVQLLSAFLFYKLYFSVEPVVEKSRRFSFFGRR